MDIGLSAPDDVNNSRQLYTYKLESTNQVTKDFSINELENGVTKFLNIQNGVPSSKSPKGKFDSQKKNESTGKNCIMVTTFPCSSKTTSSAAACVGPAWKGAITSEESTPDDNIKSVNPPCRHSVSLPVAPKPVSAMKGSREKRGVTPPVKLTVKWAPDVYDPIPTSVSHTITNNRPRRQNKNSKNKHKKGTKSTCGIKHKDKKQTRKCGGNSANTGFKSPEHEEHESVNYCEPPSTDMDFHPDQFCGISFLKRYGTSLNISSVAEAT